MDPPDAVRALQLHQSLHNTLLRAVVNQAGTDGADRVAQELRQRISKMMAAEWQEADAELISDWMVNVLMVLRRS